MLRSRTGPNPLRPPVTHRFGEVRLTERGRALQIRDRPGNPQKPVEPASRERELFGDGLGKPRRAARKRRVFAQRRPAEFGVGNALTLYGAVSRRLDAAADDFAKFAGGRVQQFGRGQARHVQPEVDTV